MRAAFLDLGTNTLILLVAEIRPDKTFETLHDEARVVRLGEGIHNNKFFLAVAMDRAYAALEDFKVTIAALGCEDVTAVGTAGFRNASNASDFIQRVRDGLGLDIRIISGEKEAELIHAAASADFRDMPLPRVVLDIGGGSTEFIIEERDKPVRAISLPFGSVRLTENFLASDPPTTKELGTLTAFLKANLAGLPRFGGNVCLIATAGTATTLAALAQNLTKYDAQKVHASVLELSSLRKLAAELAGEPFSRRQKRPCLEPKRADVIVAGAEILKTVAEHFGVTRITVSDRGLRYGLLAEKLRNFEVARSQK